MNKTPLFSAYRTHDISNKFAFKEQTVHVRACVYTRRNVFTNKKLQFKTDTNE